MILAGILALIGAGAFSYHSFEQAMGPRERAQEVPVVIAKKETVVVAKSTSTQATTKKIAVKTPTVVTPVNGATAPAVVATEKTVVAPGPLRAPATPPTSSSILSVRGVIEYTNIARAQNGGFPALIENELLNRDAQMKLDDMFAKQYFEHVSPTGIGPADLAKVAGYAFVIVGENLALGDFGSDQGVVTAWMNSPGHRANILNTHYQEIGVAVGKGMYEGYETWMAVQSFGMPLSSCPATSPELKAQIDANNIEITRRRTELDAKKAQIDATSPADPSYNTFVGEFNTLVPQYNALVESNRTAVATYNASVQAFNACIGAVSTH